MIFIWLWLKSFMFLGVPNISAYVMLLWSYFKLKCLVHAGDTTVIANRLSVWSMS